MLIELMTGHVKLTFLFLRSEDIKFKELVNPDIKVLQDRSKNKIIITDINYTSALVLTLY